MCDNHHVVRSRVRGADRVWIVLVGPAGEVLRAVFVPGGRVDQRDVGQLGGVDLLNALNSLHLYIGIGGGGVFLQQLICRRILPPAPVVAGGREVRAVQMRVVQVERRRAAEEATDQQVETGVGAGCGIGIERDVVNG